VLMADVLEVTAAVIERGGRILIAKRPKHKVYPGKWEFPGGKIEKGETPENCLKREIREELGTESLIERPLLVWDYQYPDGKKYRFYSFVCRPLEDNLQMLVHEELAWVSPDDLKNFDLLDADRVLVEEIKKSL